MSYVTNTILPTLAELESGDWEDGWLGRRDSAVPYPWNRGALNPGAE